MPPPVSVLLPVRNGARTLPSALHSLRRQTLREFELVLVDDGSTDGGVELARRRWGDDLVVVEPGRVGLVRALRVGLEACGGEVVARMDADDLAHPARLERQARFLEAHPEVDLVASRVELFSEEGAPGAGHQRYVAWQNALLTHEDMARERFVESPLAHPSVAFRRRAVLSVGGYRECGGPEDYDLWLRAFEGGLGFAKLPEVLLRWRDGPRRASRTDPRYAPEAFLRLKAHHLARGPLAGAGRAAIWGAGRVGRRLAHLLEAEGIAVPHFVDVDPRKIDGRRVVGPGALDRLAGLPLLAAVGSLGARERIRRAAADAGWVEGRDLWCVA